MIEFVSHIKVGVLGVVGIAGLLYTTYSLIDKIETTLNAIWRVQQGRSLTRKFTDYLSVVLVGPGPRRDRLGPACLCPKQYRRSANY